MAELTRREFNTLLLSGTLASVLPGCAGAFDGSVAWAGGQAVLTYAQFPSLAMVGGSAIVDVQNSFPIVVVRTSQTAAAALSAVCTHQGCIMSYETSKMDIYCACHDGHFDLTGAVLHGPPPVPLPSYSASVEDGAIVVQIAG